MRVGETMVSCGVTALCLVWFAQSQALYTLRGTEVFARRLCTSVGRSLRWCTPSDAVWCDAAANGIALYERTLWAVALCAVGVAAAGGWQALNRRGRCRSAVALAASAAMTVASCVAGAAVWDLLATAKCAPGTPLSQVHGFTWGPAPIALLANVVVGLTCCAVAATLCQA